MENKKDQRLRVCMLSYYYFPEYSGSAIQASNLCHHLNADGVDTFVVSAQFSSKIKKENVDGIMVNRLPIISRSMDWQIISFWFSMSLFLIKNRNSYDIIHSHGTYIQSFSSLLAKLLGKKSILKIAMANSDVDFKNQGRLFGSFNKFCVDKFDSYIATSNEIYDELLGKGFNEKKIHHLPNGVDTVEKMPSDFKIKQQLKKDLKIPDCPVVLFVGHINQRKNVDLVLRVFNSALKKGAVGHLLLVGPICVGNRDEKNPYYEDLVRYVDEQGISKHVDFAGHQDNVNAYYNASDIFLFPSKREGMPNVLLEAMSCGLAPIVSNISGTQDIVDHDLNGYLYNLDEEQAFEDSLFDMLTNKELREKIACEARKKIEDHYSLKEISKRYRALYKSLSAKPI